MDRIGMYDKILMCAGDMLGTAQQQQQLTKTAAKYALQHYLYLAITCLEMP